MCVQVTLTSQLVYQFSCTHVRQGNFNCKCANLSHGFPEKYSQREGKSVSMPSMKKNTRGL